MLPERWVYPSCHVLEGPQHDVVEGVLDVKGVWAR